MLRDEVLTDPEGLGYSALSDQGVADSLNDATQRARDVISVSSADIHDALDPSEYTALTTSQKAVLSDIFSLSEVRVQGNTRTVLLSLFASGSATRAALVALTAENISRATELGLGVVKVGHVMEARR